MANINLSEISSSIKEQIKAYKEDIQTENVGHVIQSGDGIALVHGLNKAMSSELLLFPNDIYGMVQNLEENVVGAILLGDNSKRKEGDLVNLSEEEKSHIEFHSYDLTKESECFRLLDETKDLDLDIYKFILLFLIRFYI